MSKLNLKNYTEVKTRSIGRDQYGNTPINELLRFFYRYFFHRHCLEFKLTDIETGETVKFKEIIEVAIWLYERSEGFSSIPIVTEGCKTFHSTDKNDTYFRTEITIANKPQIETETDIGNEAYAIKR